MTGVQGRVLIVDDSAFMRIALRRIIESEPSMRVVGEARDGAEAVELARSLQPDVITMDVEMAGMDGLDATRTILSANTAPPGVVPAIIPAIIMVSNHTQEGTQSTVQALKLGAVDYVSKSSALSRQDLAQVDTLLREKLRYWSGRIQKRASAPPPAPTTPAPAAPGQVDLIAIGASTGGPSVLGPLLRAAGRLCVPVVIAQHMPPRYTTSLAEILRAELDLDVREGEHGMPLAPGLVVILPGGQDGAVAPTRQAGAGFELRLTTSAAAVHPNADLLFGSAALVARAPVAVILTGMGMDGTAGAGKMRARNRPVLVQDPASCIVDGMPGAAIAAGVASETLSIEGIGSRLGAWASEERKGATWPAC